MFTVLSAGENLFFQAPGSGLHTAVSEEHSPAAVLCRFIQTAVQGFQVPVPDGRIRP